MEILRASSRWMPLVLAFGLTACTRDRAALLERESAGQHGPSSPKTAAEKLEGQHAGDVRDDNSLKMKFVWCPAGEFQMGGPGSKATSESRETGPIAVKLSQGFWLAQFEVTQGQWESVMKTKPWKGKTYVKKEAGCAATYVNWDNAVEFCQKLTDLERKAGRLTQGWEYTLPTEAQWENACRAGTTTTYSFGDAVSELGDYARWGGLIGGGNARTEQYADRGGLKKPNPWGFSDMHGNVLEWCLDVRVGDLPGGLDPLVATGGTSRVCRGGSWDLTADHCASAARGWYEPSFLDYSVGFRVACSRTAIPPPDESDQFRKSAN
jgi:formylglycine-generating enzyme required for sulfatase activity